MNTIKAAPVLKVVHRATNLEQRIRERINFLSAQKVVQVQGFANEAPIKWYNKSLEVRIAELEWVLRQSAA